MFFHPKNVLVWCVIYLHLISDDLAIDYQFTFNLSKAEDKHLRGINFKNTPTKHEVDVDFSITCSVPAKMNMTVKYTSGGKFFV